MSSKISSNPLFDIKDVEKLLFNLAKNWYVVAFCVLATFAAAYIYIHKQPDLYQVRTQILLKAEETYDYQNVLYRGLGAGGAYASYEKTASQMRVMKSSSILNEVLDRLNLDVSYIIQGRLRTTEVFDHVPFVVKSENFGANRVKNFKLAVLSEEAYRLVYDLNGAEVSQEYNFGDMVLDNGLLFRIDKNPNLNAYSLPTLRNIDYEFTLNPRSSLIKKFQRSIEVKNIDYTSIVEITLKDNIPERAKMFLDTLGSVYIRYSLENKVDVNENTLVYINKQIKEVTEIIESIEQEIESYKESRSILNLSKEEESYFQRLIEVESELAEFKIQKNSISKLVEYVSEIYQDEVSLPPALYVLSSDAYLNQLVNSLYQLHINRIDLLTRVSESNLTLEKTTREIDAKRQELLTYLFNYEKAIDEKIVNLSAQIDDYEERIRFIPKTQRELLNIERKLLVNEELYSFLLSKRAETVIARAGIVPETKVIESPQNTGVVFPEREKFLGQWVLIGLIIGVSVSVIKVLLFEKVETIDQLKSSTDMSVLGMIPSLKEEAKFLFQETNTRSKLYESFRSLRANLQFMGTAKDKNLLLVTSLNPGEGKTFTSVNMAFVLSKTKKRVLLIDCDLHKPKVGKVFDRPSGPGLSTILTTKADIADIVVKHDDYLDILFSGPVPPNASELVASDDFRIMIDELKEVYDFVLIDTPPISLITDALVMMSWVDIKLFVMNSKHTTRRTVKHLEEIIQESKIVNGAIVLNNAKRPFSRYYTGLYRYYYGQGYGYDEGGDA